LPGRIVRHLGSLKSHKLPRIFFLKIKWGRQNLVKAQSVLVLFVWLGSAVHALGPTGTGTAPSTPPGLLQCGSRPLWHAPSLRARPVGSARTADATRRGRADHGVGVVVDRNTGGEGRRLISRKWWPDVQNRARSVRCWYETASYRLTAPISAPAPMLRSSDWRVRSAEHEDHDEHGRAVGRCPLPSSPEQTAGAHGFHFLRARWGWDPWDRRVRR
jgi:hypothetical protein